MEKPTSAKSRRSSCVTSLCRSGLDPQVGYLHALRPARPALALDLMEEFRPVFADRLALTLINRGQLGAKDFEALPGGAVRTTEDGRRTVLKAFQGRKAEELQHRLLKQGPLEHSVLLLLPQPYLLNEQEPLPNLNNLQDIAQRRFAEFA